METPHTANVWIFRGDAMDFVNPITVTSTAIRHLLDANITFGQMSDRFNARDTYRDTRAYSDDQRLGAGIGSAMAVAAPVAGGAAWIKGKLKVPDAVVAGGLEQAARSGLRPEMMRNVGRGVGALALGGAAYVGVRKTIEVTQDDGHLGAVGAASGLIAGTAAGARVGRQFGGPLAAMAGGLGGVAAGIAGYQGGKRLFDVGPGHLDDKIKQDPQVDDGYAHLGKPGAAVGVGAGVVAGAAGAKVAGLGGRGTAIAGVVGGVAAGALGYVGGSRLDGHGAAGRHIERSQSFARGGYNAFHEVGPTSQGISLASGWGMRDAIQNKYSNSERAGAMHLDLLAAGIFGGGALAVISTLNGAPRFALRDATSLKSGTNVAGKVLMASPVTGSIQATADKLGLMSKTGTKGAVIAAGVGAAAVGIAGVTQSKAFQNDMETYGRGGALALAGGTAAATLGTAALASRSSAMAGITSGGVKAASSLLVGAALVGAISSVRLPLQQFFNDAKDAHKANGKVDTPVAAAAVGTGVVAGGVAAWKGLDLKVPQEGVKFGRLPHIGKGAIVAAGAVAGAAALGGIGYGLSATMPDIKGVTVSVVGGALAGAAAGKAFRGMGVVPGMIGGAALGLTASSQLRDDAPAVSDVVAA